MPTASLARILLFPIKSLDPISVSNATITEGGSLQHDREWAIFDAKDKIINGKREPRLHLIRAVYDAEITHVTLNAPDVACVTLPLSDCEAVAKWLGAFLKQPMTLRRNTYTGFPDDLEASGPTLVSRASLHAMTEWFAARPEDPDAPGVGFDQAEAALRFRTNLELEATAGDAELPAFWEDQLFAGEEEEVAFRIGVVDFRGQNPCQRCAVPGRDSQTGEVTPRFKRVFSELRKATLPTWVNPQRFNHFYRFAVNTRLIPGQAGRTLRCGDILVSDGVAVVK